MTASQLDLFSPAPRPVDHDELCGVLPISPAEEGPDGSLCSWWRAGTAARYAGQEWYAAWSVTPVPVGCLAYEGGARWFYAASTRTTTAVGSGRSSGPMRGTRDEVAAHARAVLLRMEHSWRETQRRAA